MGTRSPTRMKYSHAPTFPILKSTPVPTSQFERLMVFPSNSTNNQVMDRLSFFSDSFYWSFKGVSCNSALSRPLVSRFGQKTLTRPESVKFRAPQGPVGGPASYPSPDYSRPCIAASGKPNLGGHQATTIFVQDFKDPPESRWPWNPGFVGHQYPRQLDQAPFTHHESGN